MVESSFTLDEEVVTSSQVIEEANSLGPSIRGESPDLFDCDCEEERIQKTRVYVQPNASGPPCGHIAATVQDNYGRTFHQRCIQWEYFTSLSKQHTTFDKYISVL